VAGGGGAKGCGGGGGGGLFITYLQRLRIRGEVETLYCCTLRVPPHTLTE